mgnify:CR=1 FL=1
MKKPEILTGRQIDLQMAITNRDKVALNNMYHIKEITIEELVDAVIAIDESVTDWAKCKRWWKSLWV